MLRCRKGPNWKNKYVCGIVVSWNDRIPPITVSQVALHNSSNVNMLGGWVALTCVPWVSTIQSKGTLGGEFECERCHHFLLKSGSVPASDL